MRYTVPQRLYAKCDDRSFSQNILGIYIQIKRKYENLAYLCQYVDLIVFINAYMLH